MRLMSKMSSCKVPQLRLYFNDILFFRHRISINIVKKYYYKNVFKTGVDVILVRNKNITTYNNETVSVQGKFNHLEAKHSVQVNITGL